MDAELQQEVERDLALDGWFYRLACSVFERRLAQYGISRKARREEHPTGL